MNSEWERCTLDKLVLLQRGHDLSIGKRGKGSIPVAGSNGIVGFHDKAKGLVPGVTIGRSGSIGKTQYFDSGYFPLNTTLYVTDFLGNHPKFVYYFFKRFDFSVFDSGSVQSSLNRNFLYTAIIDKPGLEDQKAIANILGTLDEKIELNKKTNETLEGITKAIFKSWFIDFDPVRAKAEGRSTGLSNEISDLFPDSFTNSELGEIPYSWGEIPLSELIISIKERQGEQNLDEFSATTSGIEYRDKKFQKVLAKSSKKNKVAIEGDIVFGLSRKVLNFGRMPYSIGGFSSVYEVFRSKDEGKIPTQIIEKYIRTKMSKFMDILKPAAREGQAIDRDVLLQKRIPKFPSDLFHYFRSITKSIDSMISLKSKEIDLLEEIRDKLATKLISGELRIPDAEKIIEEAGI